MAPFVKVHRWWFDPDHESLIYRCPECNRETCLIRGPDLPKFTSLLQGHTVDSEGVVSPSMVCPHPGCGWHVWGVLDGWKQHRKNHHELHDGLL